jgi:hypothetical protein
MVLFLSFPYSILGLFRFRLEQNKIQVFRKTELEEKPYFIIRVKTLFFRVTYLKITYYEIKKPALLQVFKVFYAENYSLFSTLAHVSLSPTVLLKTNFSADESLSTQ